MAVPQPHGAVPERRDQRRVGHWRRCPPRLPASGHPPSVHHGIRRPAGELIAVRLYAPGLARARSFIEAGGVYLDGRAASDEHQPSEGDKIGYQGQHGLAAYGKWHLATDDQEDEHSRERYLYIYGDFISVHRCALLAIEDEAAAAGHRGIQTVAAQLGRVLDLLRRDAELGRG
jgi:hypothetical protein